MDDDWDLHAVVRGCAATVATTTVSTAAAAPLPSNSSYHDDQNSFDFSGLGGDTNEGLQEIYQDFYFDDPPLPPAAASANMSAPPPLVLQPHQHMMQVKPPLGFSMQIQENVQLNIHSNLPIRPRRRKNQQKKIVRQMTQEELSADSWAWRKYGQKPIKGSPHPRNYYRCSTSKGCAARKQVERSPNDPESFVVSYSGEHTHPRPAHRSSLAGITRSKLASPAKSGASNNPFISPKDAMAASSSSSAAASSFSPDTPSMEGEAAAQNDDVRMAEEEDDGDEDEENMIMISNDLMNEDDDMLRGFPDSDDHSSGAGDFFPSGLLSSPPWNPTTSAATFSAGGGG